MQCHTHDITQYNNNNNNDFDHVNVYLINNNKYGIH